MSGGGYQPDRREVLALAAGAAIAAAAGDVAAAPASHISEAPRTGRDVPFDDDWLFYRGAAAEPLQVPSLNDADWRHVDLPHDWSIEAIPDGKPPRQIGPFNRDAKGGTSTGFTEGGEGWYRKHFRVDQFDPLARVEIAFGGAYLETDIWLNGVHLGQTEQGYIPFSYDLTPHLSRRGDNLIAVRVRNLGKNSRWYSGSGLYRQVTLDILPPDTRIARSGVGAWTSAIEDGIAQIEVETRIESPLPGMEVLTRLVDATGAIIAEASGVAQAVVKQTLRVRAPRLWSPGSPSLYRLQSFLRRGTEVIDTMDQPFGVRIIEFDAQRGMAINGQQTKLWGACVHHDNGLLGACAFRDADERRIKLLKARGFNAIRSAHNPSSKSLRDACERLGMLLIEEAFDVWHEHKEPEDFATHFSQDWEKVIEAMVMASRNSPAVIMWSIGNEIPYRATDEGVEWEWKLANAVKRLDPTRPVTAGLNGVLGAPMKVDADTAIPGRVGKLDNASTIFIDVPGYNYRLEDIEPEHAAHPERVVYASESFASDMIDYKRLSDRAPYFLGEFVWTAMDYIGEAGVGANAQLKKGNLPFFIPGWPWINAWCGDLDLTGAQKASSLARDVIWGASGLELLVQRPIEDGRFEYVSNWGWSDELQSWSWPQATGRDLNVRLYTSGDRVELRLNGRLVGQKAVTDADRMRVEFAVAYEPGQLEAVAFKQGRQIGKRSLRTAGAPSRLRLRAEEKGHQTGRQSLAYVRVEIVDAKGQILPDEVRNVDLSVEGPADLVAFGSANPLAVGSLQAPTAQSYRGQLLAILRGKAKPGSVTVRATSAGLQGASINIVVG